MAIKTINELGPIDEVVAKLVSTFWQKKNKPSKIDKYFLNFAKGATFYQSWSHCWSHTHKDVVVVTTTASGR